jgi:hypothetical protein
MKINLLHLGGNGGVPKIWNRTDKLNIISSDGVWQNKKLAFCRKVNSRKENLFFSSSGGWRKFFIYKDKFLSSFHRPSQIQNNRYSKKSFEIVRTLYVKPITIDKFSKERNLTIHALDIDCQGHTLPILKGAKNSLKKVLLIKCEVDFIELYKNASHAGDIFNFLRGKGYCLVRTFSCGNERFPYSYDTPNYSKKRSDGLIAWMDCVFLKNPARVRKQSRSQRQAFKQICGFIGTPSLYIP